MPRALVARTSVLGTATVVAAAGAYLVTRQPVLFLVGLAALAAVAVAASNLALAVSVLVVSFYFDGYLNSGAGFLTPAKAIGLLAIAAWLLDWGVGRERVYPARQLRWIGPLALWIVASIAGARDEGRAVVVGTRYLIFFALFFL